ncbi:site-specific integrase [Asaia sp. VD9]|uniref:site-specific integrase n=1 Tax=Asaia sp. VD9 TaxID=3081235 RepID=UPI003017CAD9
MTNALSLPDPAPETLPVNISQAADMLAAAALSPATLRAYRTSCAAFSRWCSAQGVSSLPARPETVAAYVSMLMQQGKRAATISRAVAAISCAHELVGHDGFGRSRKVKDALKGMRRIIGTAPDKKAPATADRLALMLATCGDDLAGLRNRALLALGFAGAFRRSELMALAVEDIQPVDGGAIVTIRRSKTDQEGAGQTIGILNGSRLRPLDAVTAWCEAAGITSGPIFRSINKGGAVGVSLSDRAAADIVKDAARQAGLDPSDFSGHSLRSGFITSGAEAGHDAIRIAEVSRHKNLEVLRGYVSRANLLKDHAGASFM